MGRDNRGKRDIEKEKRREKNIGEGEYGEEREAREKREGDRDE